jgi:hypothetical protein
MRGDASNWRTSGASFGSASIAKSREARGGEETLGDAVLDHPEKRGASMEDSVLFHEEQSFQQIWVRLLVIAIFGTEVLVFGNGMLQQLIFRRTWGTHPLSDPLLFVVGSAALLLSGGILALVWKARLIAEVRSDGLYVRFVPFHRSFLFYSLESLRSWEAVTYHPMLEYGGWGIRYGTAGKAYNVRGDRGVRLEFRDGKKVLIGSQRPEELARALDAAREAGGR